MESRGVVIPLHRILLDIVIDNIARRARRQIIEVRAIESEERVLVHEDRSEARDDESRKGRECKRKGDAEEFPCMGHPIELGGLEDFVWDLTHLIGIDKRGRSEVDKGVKKDDRDVGLHFACREDIHHLVAWKVFLGEIEDFQVVEILKEDDHDRRGKNRRQEQYETEKFTADEATGDVKSEKQCQRDRNRRGAKIEDQGNQHRLKIDIGSATKREYLLKVIEETAIRIGVRTIVERQEERVQVHIDVED